MVSIECPWCTAPVFVDLIDEPGFGCAECAIEVEIAPDPVLAPVARAA